MDGKGTHRTRGSGGTPDTARVVDRSVAFDLPEKRPDRKGERDVLPPLAPGRCADSERCCASAASDGNDARHRYDSTIPEPEPTVK